MCILYYMFINLFIIYLFYFSHRFASPGSPHVRRSLQACVNSFSCCSPFSKGSGPFPRVQALFQGLSLALQCPFPRTWGMWCLQLFQDSIHSFWEGEVLALFQGPGAPLHLVGVQAVGHGLSTHFIIIITDDKAAAPPHCMVHLAILAKILVGGPMEPKLVQHGLSQGLHHLQGGHFSCFGPHPGEQVHICFPSNLSSAHSFALQTPVLLARVPYQSTRTFGFSKLLPFSCFCKGFSFALPPLPFPRALPFPRTLPGLVAGRHQDQPPTQPPREVARGSL